MARKVSTVLTLKDQMSSKLKGIQKNVTATAGRIKKIGGSITRTGRTLTNNVTMPLIALGTAAGKMYVDFNASMTKVKTIADASGVSMAGMQNKIMALSDQTGVESTKIAASMYDAISAGQTTAKGALEMTRSAVELGKAGYTETGKAMDILTTIANSYGRAAGSVTQISDKLITIQNKGKVTVDQLAESMGAVIPTARANSVSINDLGAAYIALTKNGIDAARGSTIINSLYNEMSKSSSKSAKALKIETGKSFAELINSGKSVGDVLKVLKKHTEKTGQSFGDLWSNVNAKKGASALIDYADDYNDGLKAMANSADTTREALSKLATTFKAKLQKHINKLRNDLTLIGKSVLPVVIPYIETAAVFVEKLADKFLALNKSTKETIVKIALIAAAVGPVLVVFGKMTTGISKLMFGFSKLMGFFSKFSGIGALLASPAGAAVAIVAALASAFIIAGISIYKNWELVSAHLKSAFSKISKDAKHIGSVFGTLGKSLGANKGLSSIFRLIAVGITKIIDIIPIAVHGLATLLESKNFKSFAKAVGDSFTLALLKITEFFKSPTFLQIVKTLKITAGVIYIIIKSTVQAIITYLTPIIQKVLPIIKSLGLSLITSFQAIVTQLIPLIQNIMLIIGGIFTYLKPQIQWVAGIMGPVVASTLASILSAVKGLLSGVTSYITALIQVLRGLTDFIIGVFTGDWKRAWTGLKTVASGAGRAIKARFKTQMYALKTVGAAALGAVRGVFAAKFAALKAVASSAISGIKGLFSSLGDAITSSISGPVDYVKEKINSLTSTINSLKAKAAAAVSGSGGSKKAKRKATGSAYFTGGTTWVGEHGPELLTLPSGSKITPRTRSENMTRKSGQAITINLNVGTVIGDEAYVTALGDRISAQLLSAMANC